MVFQAVAVVLPVALPAGSLPVGMVMVSPTVQFTVFVEFMLVLIGNNLLITLPSIQSLIEVAFPGFASSRMSPIFTLKVPLKFEVGAVKSNLAILFELFVSPAGRRGWLLDAGVKLTVEFTVVNDALFS